jgi:hypothetical protein
MVMHVVEEAGGDHDDLKVDGRGCLVNRSA